MIRESKYCSHAMEELVMTNEDNENSMNSSKCWIYNNDYIDNGIKVRDLCQITGKYRGSTYRDCNINLKL